MSRHHLQADWKEGRAWITDLSSTNGTFVNGSQIPPMTPGKFVWEMRLRWLTISLGGTGGEGKSADREEPENDWSTLEQAVYENLSSRYEIQVIRDSLELEESRQEKTGGMMLVEESLYGKYLERHQIGWLILLKPEMKTAGSLLKI